MTINAHATRGLITSHMEVSKPAWTLSQARKALSKTHRRSLACPCQYSRLLVCCRRRLCLPRLSSQLPVAPPVISYSCSISPGSSVLSSGRILNLICRILLVAARTVGIFRTVAAHRVFFFPRHPPPPSATHNLFFAVYLLYLGLP